MQTESPDSEDRRMPFWGHLDELRTRIVTAVIAVAVGFGIAYGFSENVLAILLLPMKADLGFTGEFPYIAFLPVEGRPTLHFATLTEPFWAHIKISLIAGVFLVVPVIMHQIWLFLAPGFMPKERKFAGYFVLFSTVFFGAGILFCFFVLLPFAVPFLLGFKTEHLVPILTIGKYVDFVLKLLLATGLVFELPLIIVLLTRMGVLTPEWLANNRKYALLASFILGAILTPTQDIFNMTLLSIPIYFLYEFGILASRVLRKKTKADAMDLKETG